jgi:pyrroline-5-carboxylate reductase
MKVSFIGYGNMAKAITKSLSNHPNYQIHAAAPSLQIGMNTDGVSTHYDNLAVAKDADVIILAVKPKQVTAVLTQIKPAIPPQCILISLAAGITLPCLENYSPEKLAIVRSMPNVCVAVQQGATPLIANSLVTAHQKDIVTQLFQHSGIVAWITQEDDMDIFTALSGSGPAYVLLFLEAMMHAAERLGLSKELAQTFSRQTVSGAIALANLSPLELSELRQTVTSPGGTTAAAIEVLQQENFALVLSHAIEAACKRAKELGMG